MGAYLLILGLVQLETGFIGGTTPEEITSVFFATFVLAQIWNGINCRAMDGRMPPFFRGNPNFFIIMGLVFVAQVLIVQYGGMFFGTVPLTLNEWIRAVIISATVLIMGLVLRVVYPVFKKPMRKVSVVLGEQEE